MYRKWHFVSMYYNLKNLLDENKNNIVQYLIKICSKYKYIKSVIYIFDQLVFYNDKLTFTKTLYGVQTNNIQLPQNNTYIKETGKSVLN